MNKKVIKVGSRKSELALIQTRHVISLLNEKYPDYEFQIVTMNTLGDQVLDKPLPKIGEKSLFTKELEVALASGHVSFVVHSLKDLPTCLPHGMAIGAVLKREDPRDVVVLKKGSKCNDLKGLEHGSVIGTSSLRRTAQLTRLYPHLKIENIRGNLNTRLKKLDDLNIYSAIVLAKAGLTRIGWNCRISQVLESSEVLYAVGQGALAVECRADDQETIEMLSVLHDPETVLAIIAERSFLKTLGGGCSAPVAVSTNLANGLLELTGAVWSLDGTIMIDDTDSCQYTISKTSPDENHSNDKRIDKTDSDSRDSVDSCNERHEKISRKCPTNDCDNANKKFKLNDTGNAMKCPFSMASTSGSCPVSTLPVGVDFMGKCPFLEQETTNPSSFNADIITLNPDLEKYHLKCPYLAYYNTENEKSDLEIQTNTLIEEFPKLYCGVMGSKYISDDTIRNAENLGISLAKKLIEKGAHHVMEEAQRHIRGTLHEISKVAA